MAEPPYAAFIVKAQSWRTVVTVGVAKAAEALAKLNEMGGDGAAITVQNRKGRTISRDDLLRLVAQDVP